MLHNESQSLQSISIHHNSSFSLEDIESALEPLFGNYYGTKRLRSIISSTDHIWCVYHREITQYIACALVQSHHTNNILYVKLFGVVKSSQGQGMGTHLLKAIIKWARREKYFAIILHTQIDNDRAVGFYEKVGFRKQHYLKDFFRQYGSRSLIQSFQPDAYQMILYL